MKITVYTTTYCPWCKTVKKYLDSKGVQYEAINMDERPEIREQMMKLGFATAPITSDGKNYVLGWKPGELARLIRG